MDSAGLISTWIGGAVGKRNVVYKNEHLLVIFFCQ